MQSRYPTRVTATKIAIGSSISGVLEDIQVIDATTKEGVPFQKTVITLVKSDGEILEVSAAGNLKFLAKDVADGKKNFGEVTTITRREDKTLKNGFKTSNFYVSQGEEAAATAAAPAAATNDVAAKLAALKAARATKVQA